MLIINVDDDIDDREMFHEAINDIDPEIDCLQFESGIKFLDFLNHAEISPDFLFIDINMPKMNGYECVEHLRQIPGKENIAVIMYSTAFNPKQRGDFKDTSIRYVTKTSKPTELVHAIKMILLESKGLAEKLKK